jgi:hypothetical protein
VYRIATFWLPVVPALALLPGIRRLAHTLPHVPRHPPDPDEGVSFRVPPAPSRVDPLRHRNTAAARDDSVIR